MPNSLPGYLIHLTAEMTQDGTVIDSGAAGTMGSELYETLALWSPSQGWQSATNHPIAGEYRAIGLSLQGASAQQAQELQAEVETTKAALESADDAQIGALTKHEVVGDLLYATIFSYLALNSVQDQMQSKAAGIVTYRLPSYGLFSTSLQTSYWFGMPRNVSFSGLAMDVDRLATQVAAKDNSKEQRVAFVKATGARASAMEHLVPEQMFSTEQAPARGISAVKALALASAEGQKIWTIDESNVEVALSAIEVGAEIEMEIRNAVRTGKVVTTHQRPLTYIGSNVGYLLLDPTTGAGAYKISGGSNGGLLELPECGVVCGALNALFTVVSILADTAGTLEEYLQRLDDSIPNAFRGVARYLGFVGVLVSVGTAFYQCDGFNILIVLLPILLLVVLLPIILGPLGLGLIGLLPLIINTLAGLAAAAWMNALVDDRC